MQPIKFGSLFDYKTAKNGYFQKIKASARYRLEFTKNHLLCMPRSEADNSQKHVNTYGVRNLEMTIRFSQ